MVNQTETEDVFSLIQQNNLFAVRLWLDNPTNDVHQSDEHGFTLLHWACKHGRLSIVQSLIERGVRINAVNRGKRIDGMIIFIVSPRISGDDTSLHLAVSHNHLDTVQYVRLNYYYIEKN